MGFKATVGASADVLIAFARSLPAGVGAVAFVVQDAGLSTRLHDAGVYAVFVPWSLWPGDCPDIRLDAASSVANRIRYVEQAVGGARFDAVVLANECFFPSAIYYRDWLIAAVEACNARGWTCIPHVSNTGSPSLEWWPLLQPALCEMARGGHYYGLNIYPYHPVSLMTRNTDTLWTTYRHELIPRGVGCGVHFAVTELAPGDGSWPPNVADTAAFMRATWGSFGLIGVWYVGGGNPLPGWPRANWGAHQIEELALALQQTFARSVAHWLRSNRKWIR